MKVGILTGGGDCPGLNAVIRAVVIKGHKMGFEFVGIRDGWAGLVELDYEPFTADSIRGLLPRGGTILGTSRTNPFKHEGDVDKVMANIARLELDCLVAIGGDDTLGVAAKLYEMGINTIGIPKTIDNDLSCTDFTFGFDTAVSIVTEALDRLHSTTESHHRVMVVEVMGRHAGWIATYGGLAGGADMILIPEEPFQIDDVCKVAINRKKRGRNFSIIVTAEGAYPIVTEGSEQQGGDIITKDAEVDAFGHAKLGGVGEYIAKEVEKRTGIETRHVVLGHLQRGGSPTAHDRILATRYGIRAAELIGEKTYGRMVGIHGNTIVDVSLKDATGETKTVDMDIYRIASTFFG